MVELRDVRVGAVVEELLDEPFERRTPRDAPHAYTRAVQPECAAASTSAPRSSKASTRSSWPYWAQTTSGVAPSSSTARRSSWSVADTALLTDGVRRGVALPIKGQ